MQRNLKNGKTPNTSNGITLVALVITIIVLLILTGVAINMAINSDGLFGKANEATEKWNESVEKEETAIGDLLTELDKVSPMEVEISTNIPEGWDSTKVSAVATGLSGKAPIPKGFVVSQIEGENTISGGLVIYQGSDSVTGTKNSQEHITAMETRNQFVWIPVDDIDYMVMCKSNAEGSVCDLELVNGVLQCTNSAHSSTATDLCGRAYATTSSNTIVDGKTVYTYSQTFDRTQWESQIWSETTHREPDIVKGSDGISYDGDDSNITGIGLSTIGDKTVQQVFLEQLTDDFTAMATSVAKYGGFYVSRYEAGANGASLKGQKVIVAGIERIPGDDEETFVDGNMWYGLYKTLRNSTAIDKSAINTHMIWGSQYDMIIKFLGDNNEPQVGHITRQLTTQELAGSNSADVMNNIYDLEGNNREWTARVWSDRVRVFIGGSYYDSLQSNFYGAASVRGYNPEIKDCDLASRVVIYVK